MKFSIASYSFHGLVAEGKMDVFGYLETLKYRYRIDAADIWNGILKSYDEDYLKKIREAMDEREMVLANLCVDGAHVWDPDPEERERLHQNALTNLRAAEILGALTVRIDMGGRTAEMSEEQLEYTVRRYREYADFGSNCGFKVGTENHWGTSRYPQNIKLLYETAAHPNLGLLLHFENWDGDKDAAYQIAAPLAMHTHCPANAADKFEDIMKLLLDAGYKGYMSVEHHSAVDEYTRVEWQLGAVKRAFNNITKYK